MAGTVVRSFAAREFPAERVRATKRGRRISLCIPARDEEATVGAVVSALKGAADEVVVVDDGSTDATASHAREAGATVVSTPGLGKGRAMQAGLSATTGDIVAFVDADLLHVSRSWVLGLVGPLLVHDDIALVKATYLRAKDGEVGEGGRVTELVAKPLLSLLFPELAAVRQPLGGEYASRRGVLERLRFEQGYGVDIGLLIDVTRTYGAHAVAQVDLGTRTHRNRPLAQLAPQARQVMEAVLDRAGAAGARARAGAVGYPA